MDFTDSPITPAMSLALSRTRTLKVQRSGCTLICKLVQSDGKFVTLSYRDMTKLVTSWKFMADAKDTLLDQAERERLFLEANPRQPAKRKLAYDFAEDDAEADDSPIQPSGQPAARGPFETPANHQEDSQEFFTPTPGAPSQQEDPSIIVISDDECGEMDL